MGEEGAGLLAGILFGDRTKMDEKIYEDFQKNGTAHLLAVSGLHISLIYSVLSAAFRKSRYDSGKSPCCCDPHIICGAVRILSLCSACCLYDPDSYRGKNISPKVRRSVLYFVLRFLSFDVPAGDTFFRGISAVFSGGADDQYRHAPRGPDRVVWEKNGVHRE